MKIRQGGLIKPKLNMLFYGATGTGKSTQALEIAKFKREDGTPFRVFCFDIESGGADECLEELEAQGVDTRNVFMAYTQSLSEVEQYVDKIAKGETLYYLDDDGDETDEPILDAYGENFVPDAVIVDGTSVLKLTNTQSLLQLSQKRNKIKAKNNGGTAEEIYVATQNAGLEYKDHAQLNYAGQRLVLSLMALPVHVIMTAREKDEKISTRNDDGSFTSTPTGRKLPDSFAGIDYNIKSMIRMFRNDDGEVCYSVEKDRTKTFTPGDVVVNPSLLAFEKTLNNGAGRRSFAIKNDLDDAIQTDRKIFEQELLGDVFEEKPVVQNNNIEMSAEEIIASINETMRDMTQTERDKKKAALSSAGLACNPAAIKKLTDVAVLSQILDIVKA
jgi:tRNA pseudouridine-54 N-methylase